MNELDTAKILAAALKLAESQTKKEVQKLREELDVNSSQIFDKLNSLELIEGDRGPIGPRGERGFIGQKGDQGSQGIAGNQGEQGIPGEQGDVGPQGKNGDPGPQGKIGPRGEKGVAGKDGVNGRDGIDGVDGTDGADGKNGIDGVDGKDGGDGKDGVDGRDGIDGKDGNSGLDGKDGRDGIDGKDGTDGARGKKGDKGDPGSDANIAPLEKKFEQLTNTVETKISRIAYGAATGRSPGSGEVNLKYLDDIDLNSVNSATNGQVLVYNSTLKKWQANTSSSGNSTANAFIQTITTRDIIPEANNVYSIGSYGRRFKDLWLSGNTIQLGETLIKSTATGGIATAPAPAPGANTANVVFVTLGPAGTGNFGNVTITNNLTVYGNTSLSRLILSNVLSTAYGGTGLSSVTTNGILFGANSSILGYLTGSGGEILQIGNGGVPKFDKLDGGSF